MRKQDQNEQAQLGFFFKETVRALEAGSPRRAPKGQRDTLPGWARRAMPLAPTPEPVRVPPVPLEPELPNRKVFRVVELATHLRLHMEEAYADIWVRGEISNMRAAPSGHLYFTLKDDNAALAAVMFAKSARGLKFTPEDGLEVLLNGRFSLYELRGQIQLVAEYLEPVGAGSLQIAFEQLKRKLEAEGLFAMDRKRPLPAFPRCIGMVTSPAGAVIRDFLNVAGRRHAALDVLLYPATVQGAGAAEEIAAGIAYFNGKGNVDVIVVARGGGSLEDMAAFNSEQVARAIAASTLPVVSAVGHETDFTIADFVADLRAPTPSAAAELITAAQHRIGEYVDAQAARLHRAVRLALAHARHRFAALGVEAGFARVHGSLSRREQRLDELRFRLEKGGGARLRAASDRLRTAQAALLRQDASQRVGLMRERFTALTTRLERAASHRLADANRQHERPERALARFNANEPLRRAAAHVRDLEARLRRAEEARLRRARHSLDAAARALQPLSPLGVLSRGYALVYASGGGLLRRPEDSRAGERIDVRLAEGSLTAVVSQTDGKV